LNTDPVEAPNASLLPNLGKGVAGSLVLGVDGILGLEQALDALTRGHDGSREDSREGTSQTNLRQVELLVWGGALQALSKAVAEEADGVHRGDSNEGSSHALVQAKESLPPNGLGGTVDDAL